MDKKLTLWLDEALIKRAKRHAKKNGKSVSRMFANFVTVLDCLEARKQPEIDGEFTMANHLQTMTHEKVGRLSITV